MIVLWDSLGTLLDVEPVRERYPGWLERVLHHGAALTLAGDFAPFGSLGPEALSLLRRELRPYDDVADELDVLEEAGVESWIVTNGSTETAARALGELVSRLGGIVSIDGGDPHEPRARVPSRPPG